jgi:hypothetical protein
VRLRFATLASVSLAVIVGVAPAGGTARPSIRLARELPSVVRIGDTVTVAGRLAPGRRDRPAIALQGRRLRSWLTLARTRATRAGRFALRWPVRAGTLTGPFQLRVVALAGGRVLAATRPITVGVGPRFVRCAAPVSPGTVPAGDGWIVGGLYDEGGPFPGIDRCSSAEYTITATASDGSIAATQTVAGDHSYTLVVPAGTYALSAGNVCRGQATVDAGQQTQADTVCAFP